MNVPLPIFTTPPNPIPDPFKERETFMRILATSDGTLRPYHFEALGVDEDGKPDEIRGRMAVVNGMNFLREAADLGITTTKTIQVDGRDVVVVIPTEAAKNFWTETVKEGKGDKEIIDGWVALKELMKSIRGDEAKEGEE